MDNGNEHWWSLWREWTLGILGTITAAAATGAGVMFRHYYKHRAMLEANNKYIRQLKRRRVLAKTAEHSRLLTEFGATLKETSKLAGQLDDQIKALLNVAMSLQGSVTNLSTLVENRGKEHHQLRELLQPMANRITILETKLEIGEVGGK